MVVNIVLIQATNTVPNLTSIITIHTVTSYINLLRLVAHTIEMGLLPSVIGLDLSKKAVHLHHMSQLNHLADQGPNLLPLNVMSHFISPKVPSFLRE